MKTIRIASRIFIGLVFIFSGFVKAVDPTGSAIKIGEYFDAFHLSFLAFAAMPLAIMQSSLEMVVGLNCLFGIRMKITSWVLLLFMIFFTVLTFFLALSNPVSDCGCFGDAIKLTNWQTFYKNLILILPTLIVFLERKKFNPITSSFYEWGLTVFFAIAGIEISVYSLKHLPLIDFLPYKTGISIPASMIVPDGAPVAEFETILTYEKNGEKKEFTLNNYPWQDSTWKWVSTKQKQIKKGYEPPIHDFSITTSDGRDITGHVLKDSAYSFLLITPKLDLRKTGIYGQFNKLAMRSHALGMRFYCLTASTNTQIETFREKLHPEFEICTTDETTLKTMVRSNPGLILLQKGIVLGKWSYRDAPVAKELTATPVSIAISENRSTEEKLYVIAIFASLFLVTVLTLYLRK